MTEVFVANWVNPFEGTQNNQRNTWYFFLKNQTNAVLLLTYVMVCRG